MTVEVTLLLIMAVSFMLTFKKPADTFLRSAPKLGARVEYHLATGRGFLAATDGSGSPQRAAVQWRTPPRQAPASSLQ